MGFWSPNLPPRGRLARAMLGLAFLAAGWASAENAPWLGLLLVASGGFALFEAARGWCVARACGLKTRM